MKLKAENSDKAVTDGAETENCLVEKENENGLAGEEQTNHTHHASQIHGGEILHQEEGPLFQESTSSQRDQTLHHKGTCHPGTSH